jgi:hypothetical protein
MQPLSDLMCMDKKNPEVAMPTLYFVHIYVNILTNTTKIKCNMTRYISVSTLDYIKGNTFRMKLLLVVVSPRVEEKWR